MNIQDRKSRDAEKIDYAKIEKKSNNQSNILKNKVDTNDKVNKCKRDDNERGYTFESLNGNPKNDRSTLKKKSHHLKISNNASTSRNSTHVNEDNYKSANSCTANADSDNVSNCKERHTTCALTSASEGDNDNSNSNSNRKSKSKSKSNSCCRNDKRGRYLQNGEKFEDKNSSNSEQKNARESHRSASLDNICERASSHKLKGNHENWSGKNRNYLDKVLQNKLKKKASNTFLSSNVINSDESKNCYDNNSNQLFQDICKMTYDKMEKGKSANNYTRGINTDSKKKITKLGTDANNKEDSSSKSNNYLVNGGSDRNDNESSGSSTENDRDNCAVRKSTNSGKLELRNLRKKEGEIIRHSYLSKIKYEKGKKQEEKRDEEDGKHAHVKSRRAKMAHDINNQQTTTHVRSDSTCSNMKIILFKKTEDRKDKYGKNDKARNNNLGHNQNSNYKKFSLYNNSRNNVPVKKEYRGNNENNGDSDERYNNYINRGSIKKIEYTKNSHRYKNNDPSFDCDNYKSNKYYKRGRNYKGGHACKSSESYHYKERYKSENNGNDKNKDLYKGNVKRYKNNSGKICWNVLNSSSKNGNNNSKYNAVLKVHDYSQNVDNYNTKNRRNNYHSGSSSRSRDYHTDSDEEGEHYEESDDNYSYNTHNFYEKRYRETRFYRNNKQYQVQDNQSERDEFFNFKKKHLKNKMDLSNIERRDKGFNNGEKCEKNNHSNNKEKLHALKNNANINYYKGKSINNEKSFRYEENKTSNSTIEGSYQSVDYCIEKRLQNESCKVTSFATNNHVEGNALEDSANIVRNTFGEDPAFDSFDDSVNQCSGNATNHIDDIMHSSIYHKRTHSNSAYRGIYYNSERVKNDVNETTDSDIANCNAYDNQSYHLTNGSINFSSKKTNSSDGIHIDISNSDIEYMTNGGKGGNNSEDCSKSQKTKGIQNDIKKHGQMIKCDHLNDQFYHIEKKDHCEEEKNNTVVKNEEDRGINFFSTINSFKHLKNSNDDLSMKTDEKSSAENPSCSNFKEFQIWIGNRYNTLLRDYIDQEKRKKNNNEVFEDEIKMYEVNGCDESYNVEDY
ncbi:hypothetical protein POVWA2_034240 [Plasmodium ovale wallikeri]|uniref:Uncharacterized protein n=1 Tax=Plasmodium ovale wallikeri TaxID=864142 RepID=A0A1A8Z157_PLAOA|nr:hypothetical protein POVWA2_034240 [Plasmodium ovale wallikeri]